MRSLFNPRLISGVFLATIAAGAIGQAPAPAPDVFGSRALVVDETRYDARWSRVLKAGARSLVAPIAMPAKAMGASAQLHYVNAAINGRVRYRFDQGPTGDQWATADETLRRSAGDCEDYAIAKLQALRALGVPADRLFMTIGHDSAAAAVHAVLVAEVQGRFWVLDNRSNRLVPHEQFRGFYPIITLGSRGRAWLHGYPPGKVPSAVKAMDMALRARRELPLGNSLGSAVARKA